MRLVSLETDAQKKVTMRIYHLLPDAMEAAYEWLPMLSGENEIVPDAFGAVQILMEALARNAPSTLSLNL